MSGLKGLWDIPGQARVADVLRAAAAREEIGHAWAFLGPAGVGQQAAARTLAAALNCPTPRERGEPCGHCDVCARCLRGAFAAYREFHPTGAVHRVDDVRSEWLPTATRTLAEGRWKVLRICDADRMNDASANAFLKGLEEPPDRTVWILDVADPDELPDTILSRCRALRFGPWTLSDLAEEAARRGITDPVDQALAARLAAGSPAGLERLCSEAALDDVKRHRALLSQLRDEGPGFAVIAARELDNEVKRRTEQLKAQGRSELESLAMAYGDQIPRQVTKQLEEQQTRREREARTLVLQAALDDLLSWVRDCLLVSSGGSVEEAIHADAQEILRADAQALGQARLLAIVDLVLDTRERLETNVQPTVTLEALLLQLSALTLGGSVSPPRRRRPVRAGG